MKNDAYVVTKLFNTLTKTFDDIRAMLTNEGCTKAVLEAMDELESDCYINIDSNVFNGGN